LEKREIKLVKELKASIQQKIKCMTQLNKYTMKDHQILKKILNFTVILLIPFLIYSCICNKDKIDYYEGRVLYDEELRVIPYDEGDTISFISNNEIHKFICSYRNHSYQKGQPTYRSHDVCEGQSLMSRDQLKVILKTDLAAYYYKNLKVNKEDSVSIHLNVRSDYFQDEYSEFSFSIQSPFFGGANLFLSDSEIIYQEPIKPSYDYYDFSFNSKISINNINYYKVICFENKYPINEELPYYFSKVYFNEEFGIIQLIRSDSVIYERVR